MPLICSNTVFLLVLVSCTVRSLFQLCSVRVSGSRRTHIGVQSATAALAKLLPSWNPVIFFSLILCKPSSLRPERQ